MQDFVKFVTKIETWISGILFLFIKIKIRKIESTTAIDLITKNEKNFFFVTKVTASWMRKLSASDSAL